MRGGGGRDAVHLTRPPPCRCTMPVYTDSGERQQGDHCVRVSKQARTTGRCAVIAWIGEFVRLGCGRGVTNGKSRLRGRIGTMEQPRRHESLLERSFRWNRAVRPAMISVWNLITGKYRLKRLLGGRNRPNPNMHGYRCTRKTARILFFLWPNAVKIRPANCPIKQNP